MAAVIYKIKKIYLSGKLILPIGWQASLTILGRNSFKPISVAGIKTNRTFKQYYV